MPVIQRAGRNRKMPLIATGKQDGAPAALLADWVEGRTSYHGGVVAFLTMLAALGGIRRLVSVSPRTVRRNQCARRELVPRHC